MAIQDRTVAQQVAHCFAEAIRNESTVMQLWVWGKLRHVEPGREAVDLWVFLDSADGESENRIARAASSLHERFPHVNVMIHLTNGRMPKDFDPTTEVYPGAEQIPLTAH